MASERSRWSKLGKKQPYWAVCSQPRYRSGRIEDEDFEAFFASGEEDMAATMASIRAMVGEDFHPARALDYGCGVGRMTIPLARESRHVVAVDISPTMLVEAQANCDEQGISNVEFVDAKVFAEGSNRRRFDFVHSYIVFQHIKPRIGLRLTAKILDMLTPGGVGALHYTYGRTASRTRKVINQARRILPGMNLVANIVQRRGLLEPMIPMYSYDLRSLFELFGSRGCSSFGVQRVEHGTFRGAMFFLRKAK